MIYMLVWWVNILKRAKNKILLDISFILALAFKMFSLGISYYPVLDDYIQYGGYPLYEKVSHVYLNIGTIATRPFASLLDPVLWGKFYPDLFIVAAIISVLFFFAAKLIARAFERCGIWVTPFLYTILLLCPLGFEGTYWISASSRICVGLFFTGLALHFLIKAIDNNKKSRFIPYILTSLLSFGFYESVMIVSFILQIFVIVSLVNNKKKCFLYSLIPVILGILMLLYYKIAGNIGALGSRANGISLANLGGKIVSFFTQFYEVLIVGGIKTTVFGCIDGVKIMFSDYRGLILFMIAIIISFLCAFYGAKKEFIAPARCVLLGLLLIFLPFGPNVLSDEVWLTYRSIVPSFLGLVLVSAPLWALVLKKKNIRMAVLFAIVFIFLAGNVSELSTYRNVHKKDDALVTKIAHQLDSASLSGTQNTIVVLDKEITTPQVSYYKDHVKSVFDSDWALTGAVRAKCRNVNIKMITPVFSLDGIDTKDKQIIYIGGSND